MTTVTTFGRVQRRAVTALAAALAASLSVGLLSAAHAATPAPSVTVKYGDLNLGSDEGSSVLYARIRSAARTVCFRDQLDLRSVWVYAREQACERNAIDSAVREIHSAKLAALHQTAPQG